jgi:regulatory protein
MKTSGGGDGGKHKTGGGTESERAFDKALTFLEKQDRTEAEVRERLARAAFGPDAIEDALAKLTEFGYVNDADYAERYLAALVAKGRGRMRIREEMRRKGLPDALVENTIDDGYGRDAELASAIDAATKTIAEISPETWEAEPLKALGKIDRRLLGRGFSYEIVGEAMHRLREAHTDEDDRAE